MMVELLSGEMIGDKASNSDSDTQRQFKEPKGWWLVAYLVSRTCGGVHLTRRGCFPVGRHHSVCVVRLAVAPRADNKDDRGGPR